MLELIKKDAQLVFPEVLPDNFEAKWVELSDEQYHSDRTALSSSGLREALDTAQNFFSKVIRGTKRKETDAMRLGTAAHLAILEPEQFKKRYIVMPDFGDFRSPKNREARDEWLAGLPSSAMVLTQEQLDKLCYMIDSLLKHTVAVNMLKDGIQEAVGYFREPETGIKCRFKPDFLRHDLKVLPDLKTCRDASPRGFQKAIIEKGYHIQLGFYEMGVQAIHKRVPDNVAFIAVENEEPYHVCVYIASPAMREVSAAMIRKGLHVIKRGMETGNWPGYQEGLAELIDLPTYYYNKLEQV